MTLEPKQHGTLVHQSRAMSAEECRHWLRSHHEGRLRYMSGKGPRSVVVNYSVAAGGILLRVADYNDIAHYAPRTRVTLQVDGPVTLQLDGRQVDGPAARGADQRDSVAVSGIAAVLDEASVPISVPQPERWPADVATAWISVPMTTVDGIAEQESAAQE